MSEGCFYKFYLRENLKKYAKVHNPEEEKCQRISKRPVNEHDSALKEVNEALRWFTKTVHCGDTPYMWRYECNEFKRHVIFMLQ